MTNMENFLRLYKNTVYYGVIGKFEIRQHGFPFFEFTKITHYSSDDIENKISILVDNNVNFKEPLIIKEIIYNILGQVKDYSSYCDVEVAWRKL